MGADALVDMCEGVVPHIAEKTPHLSFSNVFGPYRAVTPLDESLAFPE